MRGGRDRADLSPLKGRDIETQPYPGLATDLQPPACVLLTQTEGVSHVTETVFEDRLEWLGRAAPHGRPDRDRGSAPRHDPRPDTAPRR